MKIMTAGKIFTRSFWGQKGSMIALVVVLLLGSGTRQLLFAQTSAHVGILTFQVFSGEKIDYLQEVIPVSPALL